MSASDVDIVLEGQEELERELFALDAALRDDIAEEAAEAAAAILIPPMRDAAPVGATGNLRESIGVAYRNYETSGTILAVVGPQVPRGAHGHLVEAGTDERETKEGVSRGRMPANPFAIPTYESYKGKVQDVISQVISRSLVRRYAA